MDDNERLLRAERLLRNVPNPPNNAEEPAPAAEQEDNGDEPPPLLPCRIEIINLVDDDDSDDEPPPLIRFRGRCRPIARRALDQVVEAAEVLLPLVIHQIPDHMGPVAQGFPRLNDPEVLRAMGRRQ